MAKTDLTNQRQVFVEEYVRSGDHLEAAKKAGYKSRRSISGPELSKSSTRLHLRNILIVLCPDAFIITVGLFPTLRK